MASDITEEFSRGIYEGVTAPGEGSKIPYLHWATSFRLLQAIAELDDLSFACKHMQEENLKLKEEAENLRSLRMDLTRYHNEEKRRADAATSTAESLKKSLTEATERVAQMEGVQEDLQAANECLAALEAELEEAHTKAATVKEVTAERDSAKELINDSLAAQSATDRDLSAAKAQYDEAVAYYTHSLGESMCVVMRSCRNEFYHLFPHKSWPGRKMVRAVLRGLNRHSLGVPDPVDSEEEAAFRDNDHLEREVVAADVEYVAATRRSRDLPDLKPDGSEVQP